MRRLVTGLARLLLAGEGELARLVVDVVALAERDGEPHVLLVQHEWEPYEGLWALPGGHVGTGETVEAAAVRELVEEAGVEVDAVQLDLVGVYSAPSRDPRGRYVSFAYVMTLPEPTEPTAGDDARDARWTPLDEALTDSLAFDHGQILANAVARLGNHATAAVN